MSNTSVLSKEQIILLHVRKWSEIDEAEVMECMSRFAKQESIEFAKYLGTVLSGESSIPPKNGTTTFEELYEMYLTEQRNIKG